MSNEKQLELTDKNGRICKANVQAVKITYQVDELIKYLPDKKAFGHAAKYYAQIMHDLQESLNPNILPDIIDHQTGSPGSTVSDDQVIHDMSDPAAKAQSSNAGADTQQPTPRYSSNFAHKYNLCPQKLLTSNK